MNSDRNAAPLGGVRPPNKRLWEGGSAWLLSIALHAALLVVLGTTLSWAPPGQSDEPGREVGIVLKDRNQPDVYEGPRQDAADDVAPPAEQAAAKPPVDLTDVLPKPEVPVLGPGPEILPDADALLRLPSRSRGAPSGGGAHGVPFFGATAHGSRFVYVIDRSGSMFNRKALAAAKAELLASLETLDSTNQFQIVFYNLQPTMMPIGQQTGRSPFATDVNKALARRFLATIDANGGTDHIPALKQALSLGPDVIFFLTDADEPKLRPSDLREVTRLNRNRAAIHAIEFGIGPASGNATFLGKLAELNGGSYVYVDVTQFDQRIP